MTRPATFGVLLLGLAVATACGRGLPPFVLPAGAGMPAAEAHQAWTAARIDCGRARTFSSELRLSGRIGADRRRATVHVGLTDAGQIRLEVPAPFGRPVFTLAGTETRATLVTRDNHVLVAPAQDIVEALTGLSLGPRALLAVLTGCGAFSDRTFGGARYQEILALNISDTSRLYFRAVDSGWQVAAVTLPDLLIDYGARAPGTWPDRLRATSTGAQVLRVELTITQRQAIANEPFPEGAFTLTPPANAVPLTLDELRRGRP